MEKLVHFIGAFMSGIAIAAVGGGITFYSDFVVVRNDMKHISTNTELMRIENAKIMKNHEERIRELELRFAKTIRDARKKS